MQIYDGNKHQRELLISTICTADTVLTMLEEVAEEGWVTTKRIKVSVKVDKSKKTPEGTLANQVRAVAPPIRGNPSQIKLSHPSLASTSIDHDNQVDRKIATKNSHSTHKIAGGSGARAVRDAC